MITPMEIQNHSFTQKFRGCDPEEVKHFLYAVAEEFEQLSEQNHRMAQELAILRERVSDMEARDKVLKDTLVTAQQVKTDISKNAEKEAELIIKEAQLKADGLIDRARGEVDKVRRQMTELRRMRSDILAEAEMMVNRFTHFVEAERTASDEADKLQTIELRPRKKVAKKTKAAAPRPVATEAAKPPVRKQQIRQVSPLDELEGLTKKA